MVEEMYKEHYQDYIKYLDLNKVLQVAAGGPFTQSSRVIIRDRAQAKAQT